MVIPVGIDIGNDKCVVTVLTEKGVIDVVYIEPSSRETPLLIHFDKKQRLFGSAGAMYSSNNPKASISQLKRLIGRHFDDPSFQKERALLPYDTSKGANGEVVVNVTCCGEDREFTAVQLMGMFLSHLKKQAERELGSEISHCVIGIPSYLTVSQRRDYLFAAEIAGLDPLRLFHDGTATALDYAYYRHLPYGEATHVVFVDVGHSDTQVTVVRFSCGTINVLAHCFDRDLGGRDFTDAIFRFFAEKIKGKHGIDVSQNAKLSSRLWSECERAKKVLTVNTEAPIRIDCLTNEMDLSEAITREEFEERSSNLLEGVVIACHRALDDARLLTEDIHSVELSGSGSRIPKISQKVKDFFGKSTSRTLNSSECVANGCVLQCGMLCPDFGLRTHGVQDILPFYVGFHADEDSFVASSILIAKDRTMLFHQVFTISCPIQKKFSHNLPVDGTLTFFVGFHADEDSSFAKDQFSLNVNIHPSSKAFTINCDLKNELAPKSSLNCNIFKVDTVTENEKCELEFRFQFNLHGILSVQSVSLICDDHPQPKVTEPMDTGSAGESCSTPQSREGPARCSKSTRRQVDFSDSFCAAKEKIILDAQHLEKELAEKDSAHERAKCRRNDVEALLSDIRDKLSTLGGFDTSFRREVSEKIDGMDQWLYGVGEDESEEAYSKKLEALESVKKVLIATHVKAKNSLEELAVYVKKVQVEFGGILSLIENKKVRDELLQGKDLLRQNLLPEEVYKNKLAELKSSIQPIEDDNRSSREMLPAAAQDTQGRIPGPNTTTRSGISTPNNYEQQWMGPPQQNNDRYSLSDALTWCHANPNQPRLTLGTIANIFTNELWYYSCPHCHSQYHRAEKNRCQHCSRGVKDSQVLIRMRVRVLLVHENVNLWFTTYDQVAEKLLGITLSDLLKLQENTSTLSGLINRTVADRQNKEISLSLVWDHRGEFIATHIDWRN